jgi:hypothetical protein
MKKFIVTLTEEERNFLTQLTSKGKHRSQKIPIGGPYVRESQEIWSP